MAVGHMTDTSLGCYVGNWGGKYAQSSGAGCEGGDKALAAGLI